MTPETLEALKASIAKWERNAAAETPDDYTVTPMSCPLCRIYWHKACNGCPVSEKTGASCCNLTPYQKADNAWHKWDEYTCIPALRNAAQAAAREEVAFLKSLLPEASS